jgi:hypothetical protein
MRNWLPAIVILAACSRPGDVPANATLDTASAVPPPAVDSAALEKPAAPVDAGTVTRASGSTVQGKIVVSGTEGMYITTINTSAGAVFLTGALENELRSLSGATVQVTGTESRSGNRTTIDVQSYEIVEVAGERPVVGQLISGNRLVTASDTLALTGTFSAPPGSRMWVVGTRSGKQIAVRSYGIIVRN